MHNNWWRSGIPVLLSVSVYMTGSFAYAQTWPGGDPISASDPLIQYTGRIDFTTPSAPRLDWSGTKFVTKFTGSSIAGRFTDTGNNFFNVIIDGGVPVAFDASPGQNLYVLADNLGPGTHTLEVNKRTGAVDNTLIFNGLEVLPGEGLLPPPPRPAFKFEFYGDSITSGVSIESSANSTDPQFKNAYQTYAAVTSRNLGAEYHSISVNGIGLVQGFAGDTMFDRFDNLDPLTPTDDSWDFTSWTPDAVVVNIGQNDFSTGVSQTDITQAWIDFQSLIRTKYPNAEIFMVLGDMASVSFISQYPAYLMDAVSQIQAAGDSKVHGLVFDYNGHGRHPGVDDHLHMADQLTALMHQVLFPGDVDLDGFVGIADLNLVLTNWNQTTPIGNPLADINGDGFVGINDLNTVLGDWNTGTPPTEVSGAIPEPGTLMLFSTTLGLLCQARWHNIARHRT